MEANENKNDLEKNGEAEESSTEPSNLQKELDAARQELLYARADFENYKRRILKETDQSVKQANRSLVSDLLNVVDLFERGISHSDVLKAKGDADFTNFVNGIEMTRSELVKLLGRFGVEFIGKAGEKFDPANHEAIAQVPGDSDKDGTILEVHQRGALLHGKLLKPARVVVGTTKQS